MKTRIQKLLVCAVLVGAPTLVQALFNYDDNGNGTCTITSYTGRPGSAVIIPYSILGLIVVSIGSEAFEFSGLTSVTIPDSVVSIGNGAFHQCTSLTNVTIGSGVISIEGAAFLNCTSLTRVTIPGSVTYIGDDAFFDCTSLTGVFFKGNAPSAGPADPFYGDSGAIVYYLPGTTGWGATFGGVPTRLWNPLMQAGSVGPAGFGFNITGAPDIPIVIEATTNLANASWVPLQSLNLTNGAFHFSDPNSTNYPARFYRIRSP